MPAATQSAGTDRYATFEEKRYPLRVVSCKDSTSPPPDSRAQYEWEWALEGTADPETGDPIQVRCWCSTVWGDNPEKESHLVIMARALYSPGVTFEDWEALGFDDLIGQRATAMVTLNAKGYPTIDKTTFRPLAKGTPVVPVTPPARPAPPMPPAVAAPTVASEKTRQRLAKLIASDDLTPDALAAHCQQRGWPTDLTALTEEQARAFSEDIMAGAVAPF